MKDRVEEKINALKEMADCLDKMHKTLIREDEDEDYEDDDEEMDTEIESLKKDYKDAMAWAFGNERKNVSKEKSIRLWEKRHPDLPMPRIMKSSYDVPNAFCSICLLMDIYP